MNSKPFTRDELIELRRFAEQDAPTRQGARDVLELLRMIEARDRVIITLNEAADIASSELALLRTLERVVRIKHLLSIQAALDSLDALRTLQAQAKAAVP